MEMEEGGVYGIKNHLDHLSVHWVLTSQVGLKVKMARYFLWSLLKTQRACGEVVESMFSFFSSPQMEVFNRAPVVQGPSWSCWSQVSTHTHTHTHTHTRTAQGDFHPEIHSFFSSGERYGCISLEDQPLCVCLYVCVCVCVCVWVSVCFKCSLITFQWHSNPFFHYDFS